AAPERFAKRQIRLLHRGRRPYMAHRRRPTCPRSGPLSEAKRTPAQPAGTAVHDPQRLLAPHQGSPQSFGKAAWGAVRASLSPPPHIGLLFLGLATVDSFERHAILAIIHRRPIITNSSAILN